MTQDNGYGSPPPGWPGQGQQSQVQPPQQPPPQHHQHYGHQPAQPRDKTWAFLSYVSMFVGLPLFVVPMIQKDDEFALFHAKEAAVSFIMAMFIGMAVGVIATVTCGFGAVLVPLCFLPLATVIHGMVIVSNGEMREPWGNFGLAQKFFGGIQAKPQGPPPPIG